MYSSLIKKATGLHDRVREAVTPLSGQIVKEATIKEAFETLFPGATADFQWVRGADHSSNHTTTGACKCARTDDAIFDRVGHGKYFVREVNSSVHPTFYFPEELFDNASYTEGTVWQVLVNRYERDPRAREACIDHFGATCIVCKFTFESKYGDSVAGLIHVHHLRPLSTIASDYHPDPKRDLVPICPNCHAVVHHGGQLRSIEEVQQLVAQSSRQTSRRS